MPNFDDNTNNNLDIDVDASVEMLMGNIVPEDGGGGGGAGSRGLKGGWRMEVCCFSGSSVWTLDTSLSQVCCLPC